MQNVPLGLEVLADMDHVLIEQKVETMEWLSSIDASNRYKIQYPSGKVVLIAEEHSNFFGRNLLGRSRSFDMKILTPDQRELVNMHRPFKCGLFACCSQKCLENVQVTTPDKEDSYGSVVQVWRGCSGVFYGIKDEHGEMLFRVQPPNKMIFFSDWQFVIFDMDGNEIGEIRKKWAGIAQEMFTQADNFGVKFPVNLEVKHKLLLITACLLLVSAFVYLQEEIVLLTVEYLFQDFVYFEKS